MSDLISRSELMAEIKTLQIVLNGKQIFSDDAKDTVLRIVNEQPTAYDIDKVVEELKKLKSNLGFGGTLQTMYADKKIDKAIEIVKQGGVADDCCEWEHSPTDNNVIRPFHHKDVIGMYEDVLCKFPYCPVCGKKIKVVE